MTISICGVWKWLDKQPLPPFFSLLQQQKVSKLLVVASVRNAKSINGCGEGMRLSQKKGRGLKQACKYMAVLKTSVFL